MKKKKIRGCERIQIPIACITYKFIIKKGLIWLTCWVYGLGLATEFRSEKIPRNSLGTDSVIPRKKVLIPTEFRIPRKSPFRSSERNVFRKIVFRNSQKNYLSLPQKSYFLAIFLIFVTAAYIHTHI